MKGIGALRVCWRWCLVEGVVAAAVAAAGVDVWWCATWSHLRLMEGCGAAAGHTTSGRVRRGRVAAWVVWCESGWGGGAVGRMVCCLVHAGFSRRVGADIIRAVDGCLLSGVLTV